MLYIVYAQQFSGFPSKTSCVFFQLIMSNLLFSYPRFTVDNKILFPEIVEWWVYNPVPNSFLFY